MLLPMSATPQAQRKNILEDIVSAREDGVRLFVCGLIHNYSLARIDEESGERIYVGNHIWENGKNLGGKRILSESAVVRAVLPDTILLEGETPTWKYDPQLHQKEREQRLAHRVLYSSPNLQEVIDDVDELGIVVRGCDIPYVGREEILKRTGYTRHTEDGKDLIAFFNHLRKRRSLKEKDITLIDSFLTHETPRKELSDPNNYYAFCRYMENFLTVIDGNKPLTNSLQWYVPRFLKARHAFREYLSVRDGFIPKVLAEEMAGERTVLLKIGNAHMNGEYSSLPSIFEAAGIRYYHFFNWRGHTAEEIETWERIKKEEKG